MKYGCIGEKLGHSFSKDIHDRIGKYEYELWPIEKACLSDFMTRRPFAGINVTIPYKKDVIPFMEEISPEAKLCGAVNTVVNREGKLYGYNTDFLGMKGLLERKGISLAGKKVLILGSGGTSGTALALCQALGALARRVSRSGKDGCLTYPQAREEKDTQVILNTTPCGMFPNMGENPVDLEDFPLLEGVCDAVYNPLKSQLVLDAEKKGIPATGGLYMLVAQAVYAAQIFTGEKDLIRLAEPIYQDIVKEKKNLVLIGMPGCGKSTIGRALAEKWGKRFFDSDDRIVSLAGKPIPKIFEESGEAVFRDMESQAIRQLSQEQGAVIATGGGAVLREKNVSLLKGNGTLVFLDAPLEQLVATPDRPLSSNREAMERRYRERYDVYLAAADLRVPVNRSLEENMKRIEEELL